MCYLLFTDTLYKLVPQIPASTAMERERPAAFSAVFKAPPRCHFFRDSFLQTCHLESITFPSPSSDPGPTTTATATSVITPHPPLPKRQFKCSRGKRGKQTYPLGAHGKGAPLPSRISGSSGEGARMASPPLESWLPQTSRWTVPQPVRDPASREQVPTLSLPLSSTVSLRKNCRDSLPAPTTFTF